MQLVKNVFLNRNKNIARKLEEALIVWLIETNRLTSKARMFEVYLNIAEWGPMVYGIREAADFYFSKRPSQLTLEECIYLASIIPKPKHFMTSFTNSGQLRESQEKSLPHCCRKNCSQRCHLRGSRKECGYFPGTAKRKGRRLLHRQPFRSTGKPSYSPIIVATMRLGPP